MERYEYKVVPAPRTGIRVKGAKGPAAKFAAALEASMNGLASDGWEYMRAETLPADERHGLTRRKAETTQHVLVYRRLITESETADYIDPPLAAAPMMDDTAEADNIFSGSDDDDFPEEEIVVEDEAQEDTKS